jgi:hypothetical protein
MMEFHKEFGGVAKGGGGAISNPPPKTPQPLKVPLGPPPLLRLGGKYHRQARGRVHLAAPQ